MIKVRQGASSALQELISQDLFGRLRSDKELATLVRETAKSTARPYAELLHRLVGTDPEMDEARMRSVWLEGVEHRRSLESQLGRAVFLRVAILDMLSLRPVEERPVQPVVLGRRFLKRVIDEMLTDPLTGLATRQRFLMVLEHELAQRRAQPAVVAFFDLDGFKKVNDTYGHARGDAVLSGFGRASRKIARRGDLFGRFGGDEFAALFVDTPSSEVQLVVDRLTEAFLREAPGLDVSFSVGLVQAKAGTSVASLIEAADERMYLDKQHKRMAIAEVRPPHRRPLSLYATASASGFATMHQAFAERGLPLIPAKRGPTARVLDSLLAPSLVMAHTVLPPSSGEALLRQLRVDGSETRLRLVTSRRWYSLRKNQLEGLGTITLPPDDQALEVLGPALPQLPFLQGEAQAALLMNAVEGLVLRKKTAISDQIAGRLELDIVQRHLGS